MTRLNGGFRIHRWVKDVCEANATICTVHDINTNTLAVVFLCVLALVDTNPSVNRRVEGDERGS